MKSHKAAIVEKTEDEIPEVLEFLDAKAQLEIFKKNNKPLMETLESLVDYYNTSLEAADKAVRAQGVNCGPWKQLSPSVSYNAEKLYAAVGREDFVRLGGAIRQVAEYVIDKGVLEAAIAGGRLPEEVVDLVRTVSRKYSSIPKAKLP